MEATEFWIKIKQMLTERGKTQEWLSSETGIPLPTIRNRIYKERLPTLDDTLKILKVFGCTFEEFMGVSKENYVKVASKECLTIPVYDQVFSAGRGQFLPDDVEIKEYVAIPSSLMHYKNCLRAGYVRGNSMEPTLFNNDILIYDYNGYDGSDGIYVIIFSGSGYVKRLQKTPDGVKIISDNKMYETMFASSEGQDFSVIGKVRGVIHTL